MSTTSDDVIALVSYWSDPKFVLCDLQNTYIALYDIRDDLYHTRSITPEHM